MFTVTTPKGELAVTPAEVANAADRLWRLPSERRAAAIDRARARLDRRSNRRDAATVAATAGLVAGRIKQAG